MRSGKALRLALAATAVVWVAAVVFAPALALPIGHFICHQRPDRSFFFNGRQLAVCARCTGLYLGAAAAAPFAVALAVPFSGPRARILLGLTALPTLITWTLEFAGVIPFSNLSRFIAALPLGCAAAWLVFSVLPGSSPRVADDRG